MKLLGNVLDTRQARLVRASPQPRRLRQSQLLSRGDRATQTLALFFLLKPTLDLTWFLKVNLAGLTVTPLHVTAVAFIVIAGKYLLQVPSPRSNVFTLFLCFFLEHILSITNVVLYGETVKLQSVANLLLRILASLIMLRLGGVIGTRRRVEDGVLLVKSMFLGNLISLSLNGFAVLFGYESNLMVSGEVIRVAGLYYDPGVLAVNAVLNVVFALHLLHASGDKQRWLRATAMLAIPFSALLVIQSASRSGLILMALAACVYVLFYRRGTAKIRAVATLSLGMLTVLGVFRPDTADVEQRIQRDVEVLTAKDTSRRQDRFSFGKYEGLGNNRGRVAAIAIDKIAKRPPEMLLFGYFGSGSAHCDYIDILGRNGIIGLAMYLTLLATIVVNLHRAMAKMPDGNARTVVSIAFTLALLYIVYSLPFRPLSYTTNSWYLWCLVGYALANKSGGRRMRRIRDEGSHRYERLTAPPGDHSQ